MRHIPLFLMLLTTTAFMPFAVTAQTTDHAHMAHAATTPDSAWMSIEENARNLTDAMKGEDMSAVPGFAAAMSTGIDVLLSSNIHAEVKPHEEEHLIKSLDELKSAIDGLVAVASSNDKAQIAEAVMQVSGAVTLTRIDVPPGLLEKISGATVRAEIVNTPVLTKGQVETVTLRLKSAVTGKPLKPEDLSVVHTETIHALVIDPQLVDYTHAHPDAIDVPGEYTFTFTPQTDCTYRVWADVTPVSGKQEYAMVDIPGKDGCGSVAIDKAEALTASTADGFKATLKLPENGVAADKESTLAFEITDAEGKAVEGLEPLMGAYAHVIGFSDDFRTIAHLHNLGGEPAQDSDRGTSPVSFHFKPDHGGFVKFYLQVKINGAEKFFPFGVTVKN